MRPASSRPASSPDGRGTNGAPGHVAHMHSTAHFRGAASHHSLHSGRTEAFGSAASLNGRDASSRRPTLKSPGALELDDCSCARTSRRRRDYLDLTAPRCMVLVTAAGEARHVEGSRMAIAERFKITQRDIRLIDPWTPVPFPGAFMVREKAILANLGPVRAVISRKECLVLSVGRDEDDFIVTEEPAIEDILIQALLHSAQHKTDDEIRHAHALNFPHHADITALPFELRMLEICLDEAAELLSIEVGGVFDSGMSRIKDLRASRAMGGDVLEELKAIRAEAVGLRSRVTNFKNELEDILNDDQDMLDMYLQRRHDAAPTQASDHATQAAAHNTIHARGVTEAESTGDGHTEPTRLFSALSGPQDIMHGQTPLEVDPVHQGAQRQDSAVGASLLRRSGHEDVSDLAGIGSVHAPAALQHASGDSHAHQPRKRKRLGQHGWGSAKSASLQSSAADPDQERRSFLALAWATVLYMPKRVVQALVPQKTSFQDVSHETAEHRPWRPSAMPALHNVPSSLEPVHSHDKSWLSRSDTAERDMAWAPPASTSQGERPRDHARPAAAAAAFAVFSRVPGHQSADSATELGLGPNVFADRLTDLRHPQTESLTGHQHLDKSVHPHEIQDVENMLEAFCLQADYFMFQLGELDEKIDDFQDDLQVALARKRNDLFALQLLITIITMAFSFVAMIAGLFGMNVPLDAYQINGWWPWVTGVSCGCALSASLLLIAYLGQQRMLFLGSN